jgi:small-conductance mechanosensitive channel
MSPSTLYTRKKFTITIIVISAAAAAATWLGMRDGGRVLAAVARFFLQDFFTSFFTDFFYRFFTVFFDRRFRPPAGLRWRPAKPAAGCLARAGRGRGK